MKRDDIAPPADAGREEIQAKWRKALRLIGGIGAIIWIGLSWIGDLVAVNDLLAHNAGVAQVTAVHATTLMNCVAAIGLCVALYVLSTVGQ